MVDFRQAGKAENLVEPRSQDSSGRVPRRCLRGRAASRCPPRKHAEGRFAHGRRHVGGQGRSQEVDVDVGGTARVEGLDDTRPGGHILGGEPVEQRFAGLVAEHRHQVASLAAHGWVAWIARREERHEHRQGVNASAGKFVGRAESGGCGRAGERFGGGGEPLGIAPPQARRLADGGHSLCRSRITDREHPPESAQGGRIDGVAEIGEHVELAVAERIDGGGERGEPFTRGVGRIDVGRSDRGVEEFRRRLARRGRERLHHRLLQGVEGLVGGSLRPRGAGHEHQGGAGHGRWATTCVPRASCHGG